jgi:hypothetical protein
MGRCNACCLLLDSFRLLRHVSDSRILHACTNHTNEKMKKKTDIDFAIVAVLHSHYTHLVVSR